MWLYEMLLTLRLPAVTTARGTLKEFFRTLNELKLVEVNIDDTLYKLGFLQGLPTTFWG